MDDAEIKRILSILTNMIRVGRINSVDEDKGTVRVLFDDKDNMVSDELQLLDFEYDIPPIGEQVICFFLPNGIQQGFCLKGFYSDINKPPIKDKNIYFKKLGDGTSIEYNKSTKELTINSEASIIINGNVKINGDISATGVVTASNIAR